MLTRRNFSKSLLAAGGALLASRLSAVAETAAFAPQAGPGPNGKFDLLIKGGTVIDPAQQLHAPMDVAVKNGKILEVAPNLPEDRAVEVVSAKDVKSFGHHI